MIILFVITGVFFVNLVLYILSDDYRFFIKKMKYNDTVVHDTIREVNDTNIDADKIFDTFSEEEKQLLQEDSASENETYEISEDKELQFLDSFENKEEKEVLVMSPTEKEILDVFSWFNFKLLQKHASLFDITTEYPDEYFEYYNKDLVLYFFSTKNYSEVYDIFDILSDELPYDVNEVNNFWQASFYINLKEVYTDAFVRLVVQYKNKAFWLKINKDRYNEVKTLLVPLKPKK